MRKTSSFLALLLLWSCDPFDTTNSAVDQGNRHFENGEYEKAEASYEQAREEIPERAELFYDLGCAHLANKSYGDAETAFVRALENAEAVLRPLVLANLGLARLKKALDTEDEEERKQSLAQALEALERAVLLRPDIESTRRNLELVLLHLFPPCHKRDDELEPNDTPDNAGDALSLQDKELMLCPGNQDLYKLELKEGDRFVASLEQTGEEPPAPPLLELLDPTGAIVAIGTPDSSRVDVRFESAGQGVYFLKTYEDDDEEHSYKLAVEVLPPCEELQDQFEPNNTPAEATPLDLRKFSADLQAAAAQQPPPPEEQRPPPGVPVRVCPGDHDWIKFEIKQHESLMLQVVSIPIAGNLKVAITDAGGRILAEGIEVDLAGQGAPPGSGTETERKSVVATLLDLENDATLYLHVYGDSPEGEAAALIIPVVKPPCPEGDDDMEDNDHRDEARELSLPGTSPAAGPQPPGPPAAPGPKGPQQIQHLLRRCPGDDDWFSVAMKEGDRVQVQIGFEHRRGDLKLRAFKNDDDKPLAESDKSGEEQQGEAIALAAGEEATYYFHVSADDETGNFYQLVVKPPDKQQGDQDKQKQQDKKEKDKKEKDKKEKEKDKDKEKEKKKPIEQMMDRMDRQQRPNLEAQKALEKFPNAQAPGGKVW